MTTTTQPHIHKPHERRTEQLNDYHRVEFRMRYSALQAFVLISGADDRHIALHQMEGGESNAWHLVIGLHPGTYRYRYYANLGPVTHYVRASEVDEVPPEMVGLDAILVVTSKMEPQARLRGRGVVKRHVVAQAV